MKKTTFFGGLVLIFISILTTGCEPASGIRQNECTPTHKQVCLCSNGNQGVQTCSPEGFWGECEGCFVVRDVDVTDTYRDENNDFEPIDTTETNELNETTDDTETPPDSDTREEEETAQDTIDTDPDDTETNDTEAEVEETVEDSIVDTVDDTQPDTTDSEPEIEDTEPEIEDTEEEPEPEVEETEEDTEPEIEDTEDTEPEIEDTEDSEPEIEDTEEEPEPEIEDTEPEEEPEPICEDLDLDEFPGTGDGCDSSSSIFDCNDGNSQIYPNAPELCEGHFDNNCDGVIDNGCDCIYSDEERETKSCYSGPQNSLGLGICQAGVNRCQPGGIWGDICEDEVLPGVETCSNSGVDNDCDGNRDNIPNLYDECTVESNLGICRAGRFMCENNSLRCSAVIQPGEEAEECNAEDDDCDGLIDNGFDCLMGDDEDCLTECNSVGTQYCGWGCQWESCAPPGESCNGIDDDCDGFVDEVNFVLNDLYEVTSRTVFISNLVDTVDVEWNGSELGIAWIDSISGNHVSFTKVSINNNNQLERGEIYSLNNSETTDPLGISVTNAGSGWAVVWHEILTGPDTLHYLHLNNNGVPISDPVMISDGSYNVKVPKIAGSNNKIAVVWTETISNNPNMFFQTLEIDGQIASDPQYIGYGIVSDVIWNGFHFAILDVFSTSNVYADLTLISPTGGIFSSLRFSNRRGAAGNERLSWSEEKTQFFIAGPEQITEIGYTNNEITESNSWNTQSSKSGLTFADNRGELMVITVNTSNDEFSLKRFIPESRQLIQLGSEIDISANDLDLKTPKVVWTGYEYLIIFVGFGEDNRGQIFIARVGCAW